MKEFIAKLFGIKGIDAWAVVDSKGIMFVSDEEPVKHQIYCSSGVSNPRTAFYDEVKIVKCKVTLV